MTYATEDNYGIEPQAGMVLSEYFDKAGQVAQVKLQANAGGDYYIDYRDQTYRIMKRVVHPNLTITQVENIAEDWALANDSVQLLNE